MLSPEEKQNIASDLRNTREAFLSEVDDLSENQATWKPSPDKWSIAEIAEHVVTVEQRIGDRIRNIANGEPAPEGRDNSDLDSRVPALVRFRGNKVPAPNGTEPSGKVPLPESIKSLQAVRESTLHCLEQNLPLRGRLLPHPILPPMDGYQWLLGVSGHLARHTAQIQELKADPSFPIA